MRFPAKIFAPGSFYLESARTSIKMTRASAVRFLIPPMYKPLLFLLALPLATAFSAEPALTIYNQNFAVVRDTVPLNLQAGVNDVRFTETTTHLEPDSVILRDPAGKAAFQMLEQNYRADPVSQPLLLSLFEGKTIPFLVDRPNAAPEVVQGKIIRSGYVPHSTGMQPYGNQYYQQQMAFANAATGMGEPIIEVDGKLRFSLPGQPLFPALADDTVLKPTLDWKIYSAGAAKFDAELAYVTGGMTWSADYSVVAPEQGDQIDLVGLVTMDNQSGKTFTDAKIKLMAGDVNKIQPENGFALRGAVSAGAITLDQNRSLPGVTEKTFDEYHLYSLPRPATLHDRETKQVEFVRAEGIASHVFYVYDGVKIDQDRYRGWNYENIRSQSDYGTQSNPKVWVMREFKNAEANHLGIPLPKGRVRFYRRDSDSQLEFTGENTIDHTPKDETVRVFTGDAFDLTGERKRTGFHVVNGDHAADEWFEIKLRNHKKDTVEIRVAEHLYRWTNWEIADNSDPFVKTDSQAIEFRVQLKPDEEKTLTYKVHYSW